ncbi:MAG: hypothetical protein NVS3B7_05580 [Candidatus Elarobacter sp.]
MPPVTTAPVGPTAATPTPAPAAAPVPFDVSSVATVTFSAGGGTVAALPSAGVVGGTVSFGPAANSGPVTRAARITNNPPDDPGVPPLDAFRVARTLRGPSAALPHTTVLYARLIADQGLQFAHGPSFSLTVAARDIVPGAAYYLGLSSPDTGSWNLSWEGPAAVAGTTLTFAANDVPFAFQANAKYWFALIAIAPNNPAPSPAPPATPGPSATPVATGQPGAASPSPAATATPAGPGTPATATPISSATPTPFPTATAAPPLASPGASGTPVATPAATGTPVPTPTPAIAPTPTATAVPAPSVSAAVTVTPPVTYTASGATVDFNSFGQTAGVAVSEAGYNGPFRAVLSNVQVGQGCLTAPGFTGASGSGTTFTLGSGADSGAGPYCGTATVTFSDPRPSGASVSLTLRLTTTGVVIHSKRRKH